MARLDLFCLPRTQTHTIICLSSLYTVTVLEVLFLSAVPFRYIFCRSFIWWVLVAFVNSTRQYLNNVWVQVTDGWGGGWGQRPLNRGFVEHETHHIGRMGSERLMITLMYLCRTRLVVLVRCYIFVPATNFYTIAHCEVVCQILRWSQVSNTGYWIIKFTSTFGTRKVYTLFLVLN